MLDKLRTLVFATFIVACIAACTNGRNQFSTMIPASATSVTYAHDLTSGEEVSFDVLSKPGSYQYIQPIRNELGRAGYVLCKKSAVSTWKPSPGSDTGGLPNKSWIVEMYATRNFEKFFVMRVNAGPSEHGAEWAETFHLAAQNVPKGRQDMTSIKEFCD
ncbi:hypothetical protein KPL74_00380 [Bacillus sp. NP157]|nr:hypothetical protein KPL74_00380 [Bacillus sp. NP157]